MNRLKMALAGLCLGTAVNAAAATVVPGSANPNLTGRANGYTCCSGDSVPGASPVLLLGTPFTSGNRLTFSVTGTTLNAPGASSGVSPGLPDGGGLFDLTDYGNGLSAPLQIPLNSLVGVFLGALQGHPPSIAPCSPRTRRIR